MQFYCYYYYYFCSPDSYQTINSVSPSELTAPNITHHNLLLDPHDYSNSVVSHYYSNDLFINKTHSISFSDYYYLIVSGTCYYFVVVVGCGWLIGGVWWIIRCMNLDCMRSCRIDCCRIGCLSYSYYCYFWYSYYCYYSCYCNNSKTSPMYTHSPTSNYQTTFCLISTDSHPLTSTDSYDTIDSFSSFISPSVTLICYFQADCIFGYLWLSNPALLIDLASR